MQVQLGNMVLTTSGNTRLPDPILWFYFLYIVNMHARIIDLKPQQHLDHTAILASIVNMVGQFKNHAVGGRGKKNLSPHTVASMHN
jgi:hypothetical protein